MAAWELEYGTIHRWSLAHGPVVAGGPIDGYPLRFTTTETTSTGQEGCSRTDPVVPPNYGDIGGNSVLEGLWGYAEAEMQAAEWGQRTRSSVTNPYSEDDSGLTGLDFTTANEIILSEVDEILKLQGGW